MKSKECEKKDEPKNVALANEINKRFIEERKIFLWDEVSDESAADIVRKLLYLDMLDHKKEITLYMSTPGGSISAGMSIYDTMKLIKAPIKVVVIGIAMSMGSILLSAAPKGKRFLFPSARVMIHQPLIMGQMSGSAVDIHIQAKELERMRQELNKILADASGQPIEKIAKDTDRDFFLTAQEAIEYGLADEIITSL
ncbi:MAG: ATP-dependent Clp protease proteolytic subunit [Opitutales bacterium]|jgi:ATP-dependent Clp protease protease subunit|nr:ATP-dependent Clp protease proteolytic subunit [Opitutales bacterium]MBP3357537.1 ATP-dependent Clp protease proteolytic subunit [Opitutales bacterium]